MAIAYDNATLKTFSSTPSFTHTVTSNTLGLLIVTVFNSTGTDNVTGVTYDVTQNMTKIASVAGTGAISSASMWYLVTPDQVVAGAIAYTGTGVDSCGAVAESFTGVLQAAPIDASTSGTQGSGNLTTSSITLNASNCWMVLGAINDSNTITDGGAAVVGVVKVAGASGHAALDSNTTVATGGRTMSATMATSGNWRYVVASIAPDTGTVSSYSRRRSMTGIGM